MFNPNREELAWAAGFFDGEGYVGIKDLSKTYYTPPTLKLNNTDKDMIDRFHRAVGGVGKLRGPLKQQGIGTKPVYEWYTRKFEHVQAVIAMLYPFISQRRKSRMMSSLCSAGLKRPKHRPFKEYCTRGHLLATSRVFRGSKPMGCGKCITLTRHLRDERKRNANS